MTTTAPVADKAAIARTGKIVRQRLAADPGVSRFPVEQAEIFAARDFLSPAECSELIAMIDRVARPSSVFDREYADHGRTSYSGDVDGSNSFVRMIERRICDLMGLNWVHAETFQGQRYLPGQEFRPHFDYFDTTESYWPQVNASGGQRSWTAMAFLNHVEEGGSTDFVRVGLGIAPEPGTLIMWNNALPNGEPNPDTMHGGAKVVRGAKYIITKWFRTRPWG
jgi:prolyl 4-hydroxylase